MAKLYKAAETSGGKFWREFENGTHNDTCMQVGVCTQEGIWDEKETDSASYDRMDTLNPLANLSGIEFGIPSINLVNINIIKLTFERRLLKILDFKALFALLEDFFASKQKSSLRLSITQFSFLKLAWL